MHNRRLAVACLSVLSGLAVLGPVTTAHAHGDTIRLTVSSSDSGRPITTAVWENDSDPVTERIAGTFSATAPDGTTVGPWRLVPVPDRPGTLTTAEALTPGHWSVLAETAFPGLGRFEGALDVAAVDPPGSITGTPTAGPAVGPADPGTPAPAPSADPGTEGTTPSAGPADAPVRRAMPGRGAVEPAEGDPGRLHGWQLVAGVLAVTAVALAAIAAAVLLLRRSVRL
ncbi:hypothetical protein [Kitasatospora camelliae]|uniref:CopC domain-containing protein n=1 Tax=Kitasatospora camelliae TaxID=3156397 RepID=A0AAU8K3P3_9ACTN